MWEPCCLIGRAFKHPRISGALGWAATLDILLLFYPVPRSVFLHSMMGGDNFANLIKYHRCGRARILKDVIVISSCLGAAHAAPCLHGLRHVQ